MSQFLFQYLRRHTKIANVLLLLSSLFAVFLFLEIGLRAFFQIWRPETAKAIYQFKKFASLDDTLKRFEPHPYLSYVPTKIHYEGDDIQIGDQLFRREKNAGVVRIACLGGSTTMNQYPPALKYILNKNSDGKEYEVMDFGCDAWTLMESTINFTIRVSAFRPDIVIVHHGVNDIPPRVWPEFKPDYTHFRTSWKKDRLPGTIKRVLSYTFLGCFLMQRLGLSHFDITNITIRRVPSILLETNPPPSTMEPFRNNLRMLEALVRAGDGRLLVAPMAYCRDKGGKEYADAIEEYNEISRSFAVECGLCIAETDAALKRHSDWYLDQVHLNMEGNELKAQIFADAIRSLCTEKQ